MPQDDADPPRKFYGFKAPEFDRLNPPPVAPPPASTDVSPDPGIPAASAAPIDVKEIFRQASARDPEPLTREHRVEQTEVHGILRENLERANAAGLNRVDVSKRPSRRKRDYWTLLILGNAIFITVALLSGPGNPIMFVYAIAGIGAFSAGLTWIMWHIMDDY